MTSVSEERRSERYAWYVVALLATAYVFSYIDRMIIALLVEPMKADLQISDTQISLLQGFAFAVFYAIAGIPIGRLADRKSRKVIVVVGVTLWSLLTAACGLARSYFQLFLFRIGVGVGEAALSPAAYSIIADLFPRNKLGRANSIYVMGGFLGGGIAIIVGGLVIGMLEAHGPFEFPLVGSLKPWQLTFIAVGLPGLLLAAVIALTVREPQRRALIAGDDTVDRESVPFREVLAYVRQHIRLFGPLFVAAGFVSMVTYGSYAWTPTLFLRKYDWNIRDIGIMYGSVNLVAAVSGPLVGGWIMDKISAAKTLSPSLFLAGGSAAAVITLGVAPLAPGPVLALSIFAIGIFAKTAFLVMPPTILQYSCPNRLRGQLTAFYIFTVNIIGLTLGPTAVAFLTDFVFDDENAIDYSMALIPAVAIPIAAGLLVYAARAAKSEGTAHSTIPVEKTSFETNRNP